MASHARNLRFARAKISCQASGPAQAFDNLNYSIVMNASHAAPWYLWAIIVGLGILAFWYFGRKKK
jgi:LPXTG-motif cell wall-anchored protein